MYGTYPISIKRYNFEVFLPDGRVCVCRKPFEVFRREHKGLSDTVQNGSIKVFLQLCVSLQLGEMTDVRLFLVVPVGKMCSFSR